MGKFEKVNRLLILGATLILFISCGEKKENKNSSKETKNVTTKITEKELKFEKIISVQSELAANDAFILKDFIGLNSDSIQIKFTSDNPVKFFKIVEQRSGRILKTFKKTADINFNFKVKLDNPFSVKIYFPKEAYYNLEVSRKSASVENYYSNAKLIRDSIIVKYKTEKSIEGKTLAFEKVFNEPKKFVVSSTFSLSGESKVYTPIEIPKNAIEFIYTLRISGSDTSIEEDGQLFNSLNSTTKKIKVFGMPLWESEESGTSLSREILNKLFPPSKDEDFTLNVFFFEKQNELKKFVRYPGKAYQSAFKYDINNSALSTQSRIGLIKKPKSGFSYIGLQSTSSFSDTYAWLDVVALYEKKINYEIKYRIEK